jgi:hypothetical protein
VREVDRSSSSAIHNDTRHSQSTYSKPELRLTALQELHYKQSMRSILKASTNWACQTPHRSNSKRRDKRTTRSCSSSLFKPRWRQRQRNFTHSQKSSENTFSDERTERVRPGAWEKKTCQGSRHLEAAPNRAQWTISGTVEVIGTTDERGPLLAVFKSEALIWGSFWRALKFQLFSWRASSNSRRQSKNIELKLWSLAQFRWIRRNSSECEITLHKITMPKRDEDFVQSLGLQLVISFEDALWSSSCAGWEELRKHWVRRLHKHHSNYYSKLENSATYLCKC